MRDQLSKEAFAMLRAVKGQMDRLRSSEASRTSLLNALDEISMSIAERLNESPEGSQRLELIRQLKPGDEVRVRSSDRVGILNAVDSRTQKAVVQFGVMQMTVPLEDVDFAE
jgi:dsDNA-specific endonuclease/ATPase MutS2